MIRVVVVNISIVKEQVVNISIVKAAKPKNGWAVDLSGQLSVNQKVNISVSEEFAVPGKWSTFRQSSGH